MVLSVMVFKALSRDQNIRIISLLVENPGLSAGEISEKLGIPISTTYKSLTELCKAGLIRYDVRGGERRFYVENFRFEITPETLLKGLRSMEFKKIFSDIYGEGKYVRAVRLAGDVRDGKLTVRQFAKMLSITYHEAILLLMELGVI